MKIKFYGAFALNRRVDLHAIDATIPHRYWEPAKWAQVLRHEISNGDQTLVKMDMSAGHFSAADRYRYLRELAFDYAWLLDVFGKAE